MVLVMVRQLDSIELELELWLCPASCKLDLPLDVFLCFAEPHQHRLMSNKSHVSYAAFGFTGLVVFVVA